MLSFVRAGDIVVVQKLDRIGRSTKNLIELSEEFSSLDVDFVSVDEAIDTAHPKGGSSSRSPQHSPSSSGTSSPREPGTASPPPAAAGIQEVARRRIQRR